MNIFNKIGNKIEEDKKKREEFTKRYWKLSPIERIDYDNKLNQIEKETHYGLLPITLQFLKGFIFFMILFVSIFYLTGNIELSNFFMNISLIIGNFLVLSIFIDLLAGYFCSNDRIRRIKDLNKRFKL
jgi:uncharacterized integral membrane protein